MCRKQQQELHLVILLLVNHLPMQIVYGIQEKDHKASHLTFIDGTEFTKEWLELVINNGIF